MGRCCKTLHTPRARKPLRRLVWRQGSGRMAILALPGGVLVEQDLLSLEVTVVLVAPGAGHVLVQAL